jgi:hypothetical protein
MIRLFAWLMAAVCAAPVIASLIAYWILCATERKEERERQEGQGEAERE